MDTTNKTLEEFTKELADTLQAVMKQTYDVNVIAQPYTVQKTNVEKQGITVRFKESEIAPTIYTDGYYNMYKNGTSFAEIAAEAGQTAFNAHLDSPAIPALTADEAKKHISLTLVNTSLNQKMLENTPHMEILNGELSAIPRWYISDEASFIVSNDLASKLMMTPDEVLSIGQKNINSQHFEAKSMRQTLSEIIGGESLNLMSPTDGPDMIVLSSENKIQGSKALLSEEALGKVHDMIGDYVILPSSIHEVICLPISDDMNPDVLRAMVHDVNDTQVEPEERLSNNIMMYDGQKLKLVGDSFEFEGSKMEGLKTDINSIKFTI